MRPAPSVDPRSSRSRSSPPSGTRTWGRPSASATATASDVLPVPEGPARQGTAATVPGGAGRTTSAGAPVSPPPGRGPSTVSGPRVCGHAASRSTRRALTRSRPPCVRLSAAATSAGSNRSGVRRRHGSERTVRARSAAWSTARSPAATAWCSSSRSVSRTRRGGPAPTSDPSICSRRARAVASSRPVSGGAGPVSVSGASPAVSAGSASGSSGSAAGPGPPASSPNASTSSTMGVRPVAARSGRPHRWRRAEVVTTYAASAGVGPAEPAAARRSMTSIASQYSLSVEG